MLTRLAGLAAMAVAAVCGLQGLGQWPFTGSLPIAADLVLIAGLPVLLPAALRCRAALLRSPIVIGALWLGTVAVAADLLRGGSDWHLSMLAHHVALPVGIVAVTAGGLTIGTTRLAAALCWGAVFALGVGLVGYGYAQITSGELPVGMFVLRAQHPVLRGLPRMTGLMGASPEHLGEYAVTTLAVGLYLAHADPARRRVGLASAGLAATVLLLTFSYAWVGSLPIALQACRPHLKPWPRRSAALAVLLLATAAMWLVVFGLPQTEARAGDCAGFDFEHILIDVRPLGTAPRCVEVLAPWPYSHRVTQYGLAKRATWSAIAEAPLWGVGRAGYFDWVGATAARDFGLDPARTGRYDTPHETYGGLAALHGIAAWGGLLWIGLGIVRARPSRRPDSAALWAGMLGLALIGVNIDLQYLRHGWVLLTLLAVTLKAPAREAPRGGSQQGSLGGFSPKCPGSLDESAV